MLLSAPQVAGGTPLNMGDAELQYSVLVVGSREGCSGTAIGPRHVITTTNCLGPFNGVRETQMEIISFAGQKPLSLRAARAIRHPYEEVVWNQPFSSSEFVSADVAMLITDKDMPTRGIKIARQEDSLVGALKVTGFGTDQNNMTNGRPRTAESQTEWTGAKLENGYGIIGFLPKTGAPCDGDVGAPAVSSGALVGHVSLFYKPEKSCKESKSSMLTDLRLLRGWLKCAAAQLDAPLAQLSDAKDDPWCAQNKIVRYLP